jgi:hypothetical protein
LRTRRLCNITRSNSDNVLLVDLLSLGRRLRGIAKSVIAGFLIVENFAMRIIDKRRIMG